MDLVVRADDREDDRHRAADHEERIAGGDAESDGAHADDAAGDNGEGGIEMTDDQSPRVAMVPLDLVRHELILNPRPSSQATIEEIADEIFLPPVLCAR